MRSRYFARPHVLSRLLAELSPEWTGSTGNVDCWSPYDVIGHLIHGEETDWIPRAELIIGNSKEKTFEPFDRTAQFDRSTGKSLADLLTEFAYLRNTNLEHLLRWQLTPEQLKLSGSHPELGEVTLEQLLATWVVHDLNHIRQVVTYMAKQYTEEVGPWKAYLSILTK